ncbi:MAG: hypothetical protein HYS45_02820 [Parcubacteria group bacterium]|nr:hypothetical protein [Parcubacteria group bacterium]
MQLPFLRKKTRIPAQAPAWNALQAARLGVISAVSVLMALSLVFLYRNFYQTIIQARAVIVLKQEVALENIDLALASRVAAIHGYKITAIIREPIPDPFKSEPFPAPPASAEEPLDAAGAGQE